MGGRKRGQAISDYLRHTLLGSCQAAPAPSPPPATPPEVASTTMVTAAQAIASERAAAPQATPPVPPAPSQQQPAPAVTAEEVQKRLKQTGVRGWQAYDAAREDPQRIADILDKAHGLSPGAIFNRIVRPRA